MSWKFWQKPQLVAPPKVAKSLAAIIGTQWPTTAYESCELLLTLFEGGAAPFRHWRATDVTFNFHKAQLYESFVRNYQLWLYFRALAESTDCWCAEFCRDAVCALSKPRLENLKSYLDFVQSAVEFAHELPEVQRNNFIAGEMVSMPTEYLVALYGLLTLNDSPYFGQKDPVFRGDDLALAQCLAQAKREAETVFGPMTSAVSTCNLDDFDDWLWRDNPGPRERHLIRRRGNPLFDPARREVKGSEVVSARRADDVELVTLSQEIEQLEEEFRGESVEPKSAKYLAQCLEKADELNDHALHYGPAGEKIRARILVARAIITAAWRHAVTDNPDGLKVLETTERMAAERRHWLSSQTLLVNDLMHEDKPIPEDEVVPSLLSEPAQDFDQVVEFLGLDKEHAETVAHLREEAAELVRSRMSEGLVLPGLQEKLAIMGVRL